MTNSDNRIAPWLVELWGGEISEDNPRRVPAESRSEAYAIAKAEVAELPADAIVEVRILAVTEAGHWSGQSARQTRDNLIAWQAAPAYPVSTFLERLTTVYGAQAVLELLQPLAEEERARASRHYLSVVGES